MSSAPLPGTQLPAQQPPRRSRWWGVLIMVGGWILLAYPALLMLLVTVSGFTGCFISCTEPNPTTGWLGTVVLLVLFLVPLFAGLAFIKRNRTLWISCGLLTLALLIPLIYGTISGSV